MRSRSLAALAVLLGVALAGCSGGAPADDAPAVGPDVVIDEGSSLGAIAGVVVDEAIRPIGNATMSLTGLGAAGRNTTTDEGGQFVFEDLEPGTYFLHGNATRYVGLQTSAQVTAGEVARVRMLLTRLTSAEPYHQTYHFQGFIQFSPAAAGPLINIIVDEFADNPLCTCTLAFNTTGNDVKTLVVEAVWTDTVSSPTGASTLYLEVFPAELDDGTADIQGGFLPSPILEHYPIGMWGDNETNVDWRVRLTGDGFTAQYNQPYDLFVTVFSNEEAPEGWSLVAGDI